MGRSALHLAQNEAAALSGYLSLSQWHGGKLLPLGGLALGNSKIIERLCGSLVRLHNLRALSAGVSSRTFVLWLLRQQLPTLALCPDSAVVRARCF
jgi:hypothetical protein